jgi:hypothetical protein
LPGAIKRKLVESGEKAVGLPNQEPTLGPWRVGFVEGADEAATRKAAMELARSIPETRPDLVEQSCAVSVSDEYGAGICLVPADGI